MTLERIFFVTILFFLTIINFSKAQNLGDVDASFCNSGVISNTLNIMTDSAKANDICINFTNSSDFNIPIKISFVDGEITNDSFRLKACKGMGENENFGKYVSPKKDLIIVPAKKQITEKFSIKYPAGFEGIVYGCFVYYIDREKDPAANNMINVIVRQTKGIDILVGSSFKREINIKPFVKVRNYGTNKIINTTMRQEANKLFAQIQFENKGDVDEIFQGSGSIRNALGFTKKFNIPPTNIASNSTKKIEIAIGKVPFYGLGFTVEIDGKLIPSISFNKEKLSPNLKEPLLVNQQTKIFIVSVFPIIIIIIIIAFFAIKLIKKKLS